jgi:hypothetical protein
MLPSPGIVYCPPCCSITLVLFICSYHMRSYHAASPCCALVVRCRTTCCLNYAAPLAGSYHAVHLHGVALDVRQGCAGVPPVGRQARRCSLPTQAMLQRILSLWLFLNCYLHLCTAGERPCPCEPLWAIHPHGTPMALLNSSRLRTHVASRCWHCRITACFAYQRTQSHTHTLKHQRAPQPVEQCASALL